MNDSTHSKMYLLLIPSYCKFDLLISFPKALTRILNLSKDNVYCSKITPWIRTFLEKLVTQIG
jgi:hypothetical protein